VVSALESVGAFSVENRAHDGVPDICTTLGWIELKLASVSKRGSLRVDLRPAQRIWMRRWSTFGGRAFVITVCEHPDGLRSWVLSTAPWASARLGNCDFEELIFESVETWPAEPTRRELINALKKGRP
jgi:hypothetical protein